MRSAPPLDPALFDLPPEVTWVMHCAEGPVPRASVAAAQATLEGELRPWAIGLAEWLGLPGRVKAAAAALLGGTADDYSLCGSTSGGLTVIAQAYPWAAGDEIVVPLGEFPTNYWPWRALAPRGVTVREVPLWPGHRAGRDALAGAPPPPDLDAEAALLGALGPRTRLLAVSWVRFQDGLRLDLGRLAAGCAGRADLVVDGIQGAGTLPVDVGGLAAFATGVHKGLLSPQGTGLLFTAPAFRARLQPRGSWLSVEDGADFSRPSTDFDRAWLPDGRRFEQGGHGNLALAAVEPTLRLLAAARPARIAAHVDALQARLLDGLRATPWAADAARVDALRAAGRLGAITALHHGGRGAGILPPLLRDGMARRIYASAREGYLRLALHGWHDEAAVDRLVDWLRAAPPA
ncbi:MAG TPA: aminotransferase class V-fold PLP-dependent enzyme [Polyangia bacterium]|jgi:selenocysteine lyase/cysteine desulfurase